MARNTASKAKGSNGTSDHGPGAAAAAPESLDQVRDILFGGQMRMVDARLQGLEERLLHEQSTLRNEFSRRLAEIEGATKKELANLAERVATERAKRADDLKALGAEFKESLKSLERRHQKLEEAAGMADADLRDQLVKSSASLSGEVAKTAERFSSELDRIATELRGDKLDTATLATSLSELATRLTGGNRPTGKGASRG